VVGPFGTGGGGGSGTVTSVGGTSTSGTLTPTGGPVTTSGSLNFELNLAHANTWPGQQTFVAPILGTPASGNGVNLTGLTLAGHAAQAANTVVANVTSGSAAPTAVSVPGCVDTSGNHLNYTSGTGFSCGTSSSSSGGSWNLTDGTHTITGVTTVTTPIGSLIVGGSGTNATLTPAANTRTAASPTVTTADMGGTIWMSSGGLTAPVISTGLFDAKQTLLVVNYGGTPATVTNSTGQTINTGAGCSTAIPAGGFWQLQPNGTSIDCAQGGGNTPTTSGGNVTLTGNLHGHAPGSGCRCGILHQECEQCGDRDHPRGPRVKCEIRGDGANVLRERRDWNFRFWWCRN
jgi:hypothetical protein